MKVSRVFAAALLWLLALPGAEAESAMCATAEQKVRVNNFYTERPGTNPAIAGVQLEMNDQALASALPAGTSVSAGGDAFAAVWGMMTGWQEVNFLLIQEGSVFEIVSSVGEGKPSERSDYFNISYEQPFRGHLRPDRYSSVFAVDLPIDDMQRLRGVMFYGESGDFVFGVFVSGRSLEPNPENLEGFYAVWRFLQQQPGVCGIEGCHACEP